MRKSLTMASVAVLATSLAACSSTGGRKAVEEASNNAGHANTPTMTVALVTHSGPGDTFWDIVRKGAEDPLGPFPELKRWFAGVDARPAVARARALAKSHAFKAINDEETKRALFPSNYPPASAQGV